MHRNFDEDLSDLFEGAEKVKRTLLDKFEKAVRDVIGDDRAIGGIDAAQTFSGLLSAVVDISSSAVLTVGVSQHLDKDKFIELAGMVGERIVENIEQAADSPKLKAIGAYRDVMEQHMRERHGMSFPGSDDDESPAATKPERAERRRHDPFSTDRGWGKRLRPRAKPAEEMVDMVITLPDEADTGTGEKLEGGTDDGS